MIVDPAIALAEPLVVLVDQEIEVIVLRFGCFRRGRRGRDFLPLVPCAGGEVLALKAVDQHALEFGEGVVADLDPVATEPRIDTEEEPFQSHVGEIGIDLSPDLVEEVFEHLLDVDVPDEGASLVVAFQRRLPSLGIGPPMVAHFQPGRQGAIEPLEGEDVVGADLAFQLCLGGAEKAFDESAGRRIAHAAVKEADVQGATGRLQGVGMIDLGVVEVEFTAGPVALQARSSESMRMSKFSRR